MPRKRRLKDLMDDNFDAMDLAELREREGFLSAYVDAIQKMLAGLREQISLYEDVEAAGYTMEEVRERAAELDARRARAH